MARNNIRLLTNWELEYFNYKYSFFIENGKIAVKINNYNRITFHSLKNPFFIIAKNVRKITFSMEAINIWRILLENEHECSLIFVQQAVNQLYINSKNITEDAVKALIKSYDKQIH